MYVVRPVTPWGWRPLTWPQRNWAHKLLYSDHREVLATNLRSYQLSCWRKWAVRIHWEASKSDPHWAENATQGWRGWESCRGLTSRARLLFCGRGYRISQLLVSPVGLEAGDDTVMAISLLSPSKPWLLTHGVKMEAGVRVLPKLLPSTASRLRNVINVIRLRIVFLMTLSSEQHMWDGSLLLSSHFLSSLFRGSNMERKRSASLLPPLPQEGVHMTGDSLLVF